MKALVASVFGVAIFAGVAVVILVSIRYELAGIREELARLRRMVP